jgi:integrase
MSAHYDKARRSWFFTVRAPDEHGFVRQVRRRPFPTKKAAQRAERDFLAAIDDTGFVLTDRTTVGEFLERAWLPQLDANVKNRKPTTVDTYRRLTCKHLIPQLGPMQLGKLTRGDIERMLGRIKLSAKSRRNIVGVLSTALADAKRWGYVRANAAEGVELPRLNPPPPRAWTVSELARFLNALEHERLAPVWGFLAATGARRGEALGLRWRDLDLDAGTATLINTRVIVGGSVVEGTTKSRAGARTTPLDDDTVAILRALRSRQRAELLQLGLRSAVNGYVFTGEDGRPYWPQRVTARFREVTDALGLPRIGVHGLRHTSVTWAISAGQNPKLVAQRHGHASETFTIGRYSHVMPGDDRAAVEAFAAALRAARAAHVAQNVAPEADQAT